LIAELISLYTNSFSLQIVQRSKYAWHQFGILIPHILWLSFNLVPPNSNSI